MEIKKLRQKLSNLSKRILYPGIPALKRGNRVYIKGAGEKFSGTYYVDEVNHSFSNEDYTVTFKLTRNDPGG